MLPGVSSGLFVQQQLLLFYSELQVQLKRVIVQVMNVLLNVAAGPLRGCGLVWRQGVCGAGLGHLHVAELAQEVIILSLEMGRLRKRFEVMFEVSSGFWETVLKYILRFHSSPHHPQTWLAGRG